MMTSSTMYRLTRCPYFLLLSNYQTLGIQTVRRNTRYPGLLLIIIPQYQICKNIITGMLCSPSKSCVGLVFQMSRNKGADILSIIISKQSNLSHIRSKIPASAAIKLKVLSSLRADEGEEGIIFLMVLVNLFINMLLFKFALFF